MRSYVLLCFLLFSFNCWADITCGSPAKLSIDLPTRMSIQGDAAVGTMISSDWHVAINPRLTTCNGSGVYSFEHRASGQKVGVTVFGGKMYDIYASATAGIAYIMELQYKSGNWGAVSGADFVTWTSSSVVWFVNEPVSLGVRIRLLIGSNNIKPGAYSIPSFDVVNSVFKTTPGYIGMGVTSTSGSSIIAKIKSCNITSPGAVKLPSTNFSQFASAGDTGGDTAFSLNLKCSDSFTAYPVRFFMTDAYSANNTSSNLVSATGQGNADGLAIQILDGLNPVQFGPQLSGSNSNIVGAVGPAGGSLTKQLTARYKRIGAKMTPGLIKAGVLVNLVYE
ncbi:fimbrial protein [Pseudomonas sp. DWP1b1]|uniref:fimbrial protein n=1 Tax=unclassified Pseudomonas TaxID=196821 RepID=UPI003CE91D8B